MDSPVSPPKIGEEWVRHIAGLARLRVAPEEVAALALHFERVLAFVEKLQEVDVEGVEPEHLEAVTVAELREDDPRDEGEPGAPLEAEQFFPNAPDRRGPYFTTPRVV